MMQVIRKIKKRLSAPIAAMFITVLLMALILTGCGENPQAEDVGTTLNEEEIWGTVPEETLGIAVDTPYMTFYYPEEWRDKVEIEHSSNGANSVTTFHTEISGKRVELFSVILGADEDEGYLLGQLKNEMDGTVNVYTLVYEVSAEDWTEEEYSEICSLQERINDIIIQFYEDERFEPSR